MPEKTNQPLSETHPDLANQWDYRRNETLTPEDVTSSSNEKVWWHCPAGFKSHIWATAVCNRTAANEKGCPLCWLKKEAENKSLQDVNPQAAAMWHPTKNKSLLPSAVLHNSTALVYWQCPKEKEHIWRAEVVKVNRAVMEDSPGLGCPKCKKTKKWEKWQTSLAESFPNLLAEWHKKKNGSLTASAVTPGSALAAWWKCPKNRKHAYQMAIYKRVYLRMECPYCANMRVLPDVNSLAATNPSLAKQWHKAKNKDLTPDKVVAGSATKVWWQCPKSSQHVWQAQIFSRAVLSTGCPFCTGQKANKSNSLATLNPALAKQWHPRLNLESGLTPETVTTGSARRIWWECPNDDSHWWQAQIFKRSEGRGLCPYCNPRSRPKSLATQTEDSKS